jgi:Tripartite tricarboxylate transporter TctB family.
MWMFFFTSPGFFKDTTLRPNAWVGLVAVAIGILYGFQAYNLPRAPIGNPMAPLYFPLGLAGFMILLGAITFAVEAAKGLNADDKAKRPQFHLKSVALIFYMVALCVIYAFIFDHAGFVISTIFFLLASLFVINPGKAKLNLVVTMVFSIGMWYIFNDIFQITLPASPFGFM